MNWLRKLWKFSLSVAALAVLSACGVKGDPLPPEKPADLGRGRPTYKRATEGLKIDRTRGGETEEQESEAKDDERE